MRCVVVRSSIVALTCLIGVTASACSAGPADEPTTPPTSTVSATPSPSAGTPSPGGPTDLTIIYRSAPDAEPRTYTLTCRPTGGTVDDPARACDALAENGEAMAPTPAGAMCTQVFGGAETANVSGTWGGIAYSGRFSRQNGCETARWDALVGLLPVGGAR